MAVIYAVRRSQVAWYKVGYWTGELDQLRARYATVYGDDMEWHVFECLPGSDARTVEKLVHRSLRQYWMSNEIFSVDCLTTFLSSMEFTCGARVTIPPKARRSKRKTFEETSPEGFASLFRETPSPEDERGMLEAYRAKPKKVWERVINLRLERGETPASPKKAQRLEAIRNICDMLQIRGSWEVGARIERSILSSSCSKVLAMRNELQEVFGLRLRETTGKDTLKRGLELLNEIWSRWGYTAIKLDGPRTRARVEGRLQDMSNYAVVEGDKFPGFARYT